MNEGGSPFTKYSQWGGGLGVKEGGSLSPSFHSGVGVNEGGSPFTKYSQLGGVNEGGSPFTKYS